MPVQALLWTLVMAVGGLPPPSTFAGSAVAPAAPAATHAAAEDPLLARAADYVAAFERTFAAVGWRERYEQEVRQRGRFSSSGSVGMRLVGKRQLESQLLFVFLPRDATWVAVRDVIAVDGKPQGDDQRPLQTLSSGGSSISVAQLKTLAAENGRYNIGRILRTFNEPTLALIFLDDRYRQRFKFERRDEQTLPSGRARVYRFVERDRPTVIRSSANRDLPSTGLIWIEPDTGRLLQTSLMVNDVAELSANIVVRYGPYADFDVLVPLEMREIYNASGEEVRGIATYSDFRRFEAHSRIIVPQ
jgi:hypothetical protein